MNASKNIKAVILLLSALLLADYSMAQVTKVLGQVVDARSGDPVSFANVIIKGSSAGATTDFEGNFAIETRKETGDSLLVTYIGYHPVSVKIKAFAYQEIKIALEPAEFMLEEVEIRPGENPAEVLLRKVLANKEANNRQNFNAYQYEVYTKVQLDLNNITEEFKNRRILKPFRFIFDFVDTSIVDGKIYLPVFLSESLSDVYFQKQPRARKEFIKAARVSGLENESIQQFMGDLYQNVNIYDNYIMLFEKNFVSPVANFGLAYYKYYLTDSSYIGDKWCYQIMFKPRRKQELTFTGEIWIHDSSYAVRKVSMKAAENANINFINTISLEQEYDKVNNEYWMLTRDYFLADFNVIENSSRTTGLFGHKTSTYDHFIFDEPKNRDFYSTALDVIIKENAYDRKEDFWKGNRHESLTKREEKIYHMVDSIKRVPVFQTWVDALYLFTNGYLIWGPLEVGPLYKSLSFNPVEGARLRVGGRTSNSFSTSLMISGHLAYGSRDQEFKYGFGALYLFSKNPRRSIRIEYLNDLEQLGQSQNAFSEDNIFASVFRRDPPDKLSVVKKFTSTYEHEWFTGFSNTIGFEHSEILPAGASSFTVRENDDLIALNSVTTAEIQLGLRFAYREKYVMGEFERISLGTEYPVLNIQYSLGVPNAFNSSYQYHRLQLGLRQWFNVASFGWSKYIIEAGKTWGKLPYPLLKLHPGNETFLFDEYAYNLMNYYEFVSDQYVSMYYTHHFDGFFLNRIPLMRKLKWREVAFVQGVIGTLSEQNRNYSVLPQGTYTLERPYFEAGVGIENIFRVFRVDAIWRLSRLNNPDINSFAVFFSFHFYF